MKINNKGYMLIEIVLASVLAMSIAIYLLNLTYDFKNTDEDVYQSISYSNDKIAITKNIMNDLNDVVIKGITVISNQNDNKVYEFTVKNKKNNAEEKRRLAIKKVSGITTITYGKWGSNAFVTTDVSYYEKTLQKTLIVDGVEITNTGSNNDYLTIQISIHSLYEDKDYGIKLFVRKEWNNFSLSQAAIGSYVAYVGNNGCSGNYCRGQNANYQNDTNRGYCYDKNYQYNTTGWRIAYIKNGSAYITTAGSPECLCTNSNGTISATTCSTNDTTSTLTNHIPKLNAVALKYCNITYAYGGICNNSSAWNMNATDFLEITNKGVSISACVNKEKDSNCGYENTILDNGGLYWFATSSDGNGLSWYHYGATVGNQLVGKRPTSHAIGTRPVIRLKSNIIVTGGIGSMDDPYQIQISS